MFPDIVSTIHAEPWLLALAIIAATFIHEDIATVATGMLVADGVTSVGVALPALYIGIVAGDLGLYGMGRLVALNRISKRLAGGRALLGPQVSRLMNASSPASFWCAFFQDCGCRLTRPTVSSPCRSGASSFPSSLRRASGPPGFSFLSDQFGTLTADWLGVLRWPAITIAAIVPLRQSNASCCFG